MSRHTCHWPGCAQPVPPAMWGCKPHWFSLPKHLRDEVWANYRRGQEVTKDPSPAYVATAQKVQAWIAEQIRQNKTRGHTSNRERAAHQPEAKHEG